MSEELLFQVSHIGLQGNISLMSVVLSLFLVITYFIIKKILSKNINNKIKITNIKKIIYPSINDKKFEEKMLEVIQNKLSIKYNKNNLESYTNIDIAKFCNNKKLIQIYKNIEIKIYKKESLILNERVKIIDYINKNI